MLRQAILDAINYNQAADGAIGRFVDLAKFRSRYAEPGEYIQWPTFGSSLSLGDSSNHLTQAQRQKNWRIAMEALLYSNGGSGAHNGAGWYCANTSAVAFNTAAAGTVFVPGPLLIEPYNDGEYAPNWGGDTVGLRRWTLPSGINIVGFGATQGDTATGGWGEVNPKGSRIICWDNYVGWDPQGGPAPTGGATRRNLSNWSWDKLSVMRKGTIAGPVFRAKHWTESDTGPVVHLNQFWRIGEMVVDMQPAADGVENTGVEIRCGLTGKVEYLRIMGHANPGWGLLVTGNYLLSGALQAQSTTIDFGQVVVRDSGKGVGTHQAFLFCREINIEQASSNSTSKQRLVIGEGADVQIGRLWTENMRPVASGHDAIVVVGQTTADCVSEGILPSGVTVTSNETPQVDIGWSYLSAQSSATVGAGIKVLHGRVTTQSVRGNRLTALFELAPRISDLSATVRYDGAKTLTSNVGSLVTHTPFGGYVTYGGAQDTQRVDYAAPWVALDVNEPLDAPAFGGRFWNKGHGGNSVHRLPVATSASFVGRRLTFMKYDGTYTYKVSTQAGKDITAVPQLNPCRLTATAHGFTDGQRKWVTAVGGMVELNDRYLYVKSIDANTVELYTDSALTTGVNASAYTGYTSGGKLGGQFINGNAAGAEVEITERYIPVTIEYLGDDRYGIVHGNEAI